VTFGPGEGPRIAKPLRTGADYDAWQLDGVLDRIAYLPRAVAHLKQTLKDRYGILGFAGRAVHAVRLLRRRRGQR
jgi:uroporphyrinogen-III decarboxylase